MQVKDFQNGSERGQFIAGVIGDHTRLRRASHIVRLGTFNDKRTRAFADSQAALMPAWAQAEMFYDCDAGWKDDRCNSDDDAMWHFKWRARLRRFNQSPEATLRRLSLELGVVPSFRGGHARFADDLAKEVLAPLSSGRKANAGLRVDLAELLRNETTRTHGVH